MADKDKRALTAFRSPLVVKIRTAKTFVKLSRWPA